MKKELVVIPTLFLLLSGSVYAKEKIVVAWRDIGMELKVLNTVADAFKKKYGIEAKITPFAWGDGDSKLLTMFMSGISPDIFSSVYRSGLADYARRGLCEDLSPYIKRDKIDMGQFYPGSLKRLKIGTKQYGLPISGATDALWYNALLFDQAGVSVPPSDWATKEWTWDDMIATATKLTRDKNGDGKPDQFGIFMNLWPVTVNAWAWGGDFFPESIYDDGLVKKSSVTSAAAITGIQKLADLKFKHRVAGSSGQFAQGKVAMESGGTYVLGEQLTLKNTKVKYGVAVLPKGSANRKPTLFTDPWLISRNSKHKEAAWKWIRFCTLEEGAKLLVEGYRTPVLTKSTMQEYMKKYNNAANFQKVVEGALQIGEESPNHTIVNFGEILLAIEPEVNKVLDGKMGATEALRGVEPKVDAILTRTYGKFYKK